MTWLIENLAKKRRLKLTGTATQVTQIKVANFWQSTRWINSTPTGVICAGECVFVSVTRSFILKIMWENADRIHLA